MQWKASDIAAWLNGEIEGNPDTIVNNPASIESANADHFSFIADPKYESQLYTSRAGVILTSKNLKLKSKVSATLVKVDDPYLGFAFLLQKIIDSFTGKRKGISSKASVETSSLKKDIYIGEFAVIEKGVKLAKGVKIFPQVFIGENTEIGENTIIFPGVKIYPNTVIGKNCIIHSNAVIGSDGFGFAPKPDGSFHKIPQAGKVIIYDDVEIGANTVIDRATIDATIVNKGVKLDNLVQIAHNVEIGKNTVIAAQAGVSGSTKLGENCMVGGQAGFVGHIIIADRSKINAQSGVSKSIKKSGSSVTGSPAFEYMDSLRAQAVLRRLPELEKKLLDLEKKLNSNT